jgi:hypothetical protein
MALPAPYLSYLQALNFDPAELERLNASYGPEFGNMADLDEELYNTYNIHPDAIRQNREFSTRSAPAERSRSTFRLSSNPAAQAKFTEEQVDEAVRNGYDPSIFVNYGKPGNNDRKADVAMSMLGKNTRNDKLLASNPKIDLNKLEPMTAEESLEGLSQAGRNAYQDVKDTGGYYLGEADRATKPIREAVSATAAPVIQKAKQYGQPIYEEYVEKPVQREYQRQKDTYNTLAADPEATLQGAKMMASDAGEYIRDTAHTVRNESPSWVARFSKTLSEGSNFGKELKDAWDDPDYYLAGGRYENKGYRSGIKRPDAAYNTRMNNLQQATGYSKPDASKLPTATTVKLPAPQKPIQEPPVAPPTPPAPATAPAPAVKQSGFSLYNNYSVQVPKESTSVKWTKI